MDGLLGALNNPGCPDGHGPMERQPGFFAMQGAELVSDDAAQNARRWELASKGLVFQVWTCRTCKLVRLYDDDRG